MSGGQKARISLARALYSTAPIVLLDDILSAVDAHVARHLFRHAILQGFRDRTVLLVTHQLQFLSAGDRVVVMHAGRITQHGTYAECMAHADDASTPNLLALMVQQATAIWWGTEPRPFPRLAGFAVGGVEERFWLPPLACILVIGGLEWMYRRTLIGRAFLAVAEDGFAARALGLPERQLRMLSYALAGAVAGLAGFA
ncbi:hypothetical protein EON67_00220, partial [archaeon]